METATVSHKYETSRAFSNNTNYGHKMAVMKMMNAIVALLALSAMQGEQSLYFGTFSFMPIF